MKLELAQNFKCLVGLHDLGETFSSGRIVVENVPGHKVIQKIHARMCKICKKVITNIVH
jgi:hypothetical protein